MAVRLSSPYRNLASVDLKRESQVQFDKVMGQAAPPVPTNECRLIAPVTCFTDNFNRANSPTLDPPPNWEEFSDIGHTNAFQIAGNELQTFFAGVVPPITKGAWWRAFPVGTTHQQSSLTFKSSNIVAVPHAQAIDYIINAGGPAVRMQQVGVGNVWFANVKCYDLHYQEQRSHVSPFPINLATLDLEYMDPLGFTTLQSVVIPHLNPGDVLKLTAMSFLFLGVTPSTCLKGFVNDVQVVQRNLLFDAGALGIGTGRAGISGSPVGEPFESVAFTINWDDWQGCTAIPV